MVKLDGNMTFDPEAGTVLVVDGDGPRREATVAVLREAGWATLAASTPEEVWGLVQRPVAALVLAGGQTSLRARLRSAAATAYLPVLRLAATATALDSDAEGELGEDARLTLPVAAADLAATLALLVRAHRVGGERDRLLAREHAAHIAAERASRAKDDLLATLSHQLRTPLNAILGWTHVLQLPTATAEDFTEGLTTIARNAQLQAQLIADMLDSARIASGKLRLEAQPVDPAWVVESALASVQPFAASKAVEIVRAFGNGVDMVSADAARLQQVVWNLLDNAVKFSAQGGRVEVTIRQAGAAVEIAVSDHGAGIAPEALGRVFERVRDSDASHRVAQGGLGLGLSIVKNLVELHGGAVSAASAGPGRGATFVVALPVFPLQDRTLPRTTALAPAPAWPAPPGGGLRQVRVLVVDDDAEARVLLRRLLTESEAVVADAPDGASALQAITSFRPQILVSDIGMPRQDGYSFIQEVRARGFDAQHLPAIALTAFMRAEDRRYSLTAGYQVHLGKPVDPHELLAAIAALVRREPGSSR